MFSPAGSICVSILTKLTDILGFATFVVMENRPWMSVAVNSFVPTIWIRAETRGSIIGCGEDRTRYFCLCQKGTHTRKEREHKQE